MSAEQTFPLAPVAQAEAQYAALLKAKYYLAERKIDATVVGSKFVWAPVPTVLGQRT